MTAAATGGHAKRPISSSASPRDGRSQSCTKSQGNENESICDPHLLAYLKKFLLTGQHTICVLRRQHASKANADNAFDRGNRTYGRQKLPPMTKKNKGLQATDLSGNGGSHRGHINRCNRRHHSITDEATLRFIAILCRGKGPVAF